tara:strand:+ start:2677 stop:2949 length:273 start_codon:yes stop_codon:yes gene_type:complete
MRRRGYRKYHFHGGKLITNTFELLYTLILLGAYEIDEKIRKIIRKKRKLQLEENVKNEKEHIPFVVSKTYQERNRYGFPKEEMLYKRKER